MFYILLPKQCNIFVPIDEDEEMLGKADVIIQTKTETFQNNANIFCISEFQNTNIQHCWNPRTWLTNDATVSAFKSRSGAGDRSITAIFCYNILSASLRKGGAGTTGRWWSSTAGQCRTRTDSLGHGWGLQNGKNHLLLSNVACECPIVAQWCC